MHVLHEHTINFLELPPRKVKSDLFVEDVGCKRAHKNEQEG